MHVCDLYLFFYFFFSLLVNSLCYFLFLFFKSVVALYRCDVLIFLINLWYIYFTKNKYIK